MRIFLILIDGFGIGFMPDYKKFGDKEEPNSFIHAYKKCKISLPTFKKLGLFNIDGMPLKKQKNIIGSFGKMQEQANANDSTAGHWEIAGKTIKKPFATFKDKKIPKGLILQIQKELGVKTLFNKAGSGVKLINELGQEHIKTKQPILYTSNDSVLQLACHKSVYSVQELYKMCKKIRKITSGKYNVCRVIARPFDGGVGKFYRTDERKDFSVKPNKKLLPDFVKEAGMQSISVGKIEDIFPTTNFDIKFKKGKNKQSQEFVLKVQKKFFKNGLLWVNLGDTDSKFGHVNDAKGYMQSLKQTDKFLKKLIKHFKNDDILFVTGDHGNDPTTKSSDHSREYVPILCYGKNVKAGVNLNTLPTFACLGDTILEMLKIKKTKNSFLDKIQK